MKQIFFFILVILLFQIHLAANGQTVSYFTSEKNESDSGTFLIHSYDSTRLFVFEERTIGSKAKYQLKIYSRDSLKLVDIIPIPFVVENPLNYNLENLFIHKDYYQILYSGYNASSQKAKLEMVNFNAAGEKIGETKLIDVSEGWNKSKAGEFWVFDIPEKNEFLSCAQKYVKGKLMINIDHFDYEGNKLKTTNFDNVKMPHIAHTIALKEGGLIYLTRARTDARDPDWTVKIFSSESDTGFNILLQKVNDENMFLSEHFYPYSDAQGNLYYFTPYSESEDSKYSNGLYMAKVDLKNHILIRDEFIPFTNKTDGSDDDEDFKMASCIITDVVEFPDGKINVLFESRLKENENFFTEYVVGNILSVQLDSNFETLSVCRIPKKQVAVDGNSGYTGYACLRKNDKLFLVYNDLPENLNPNGKVKAVRYANLDRTAVNLLTLERNKQISKQILIEKKDSLAADRLIFYPITRTTDKELYTYRIVGEKYFLTKIFIREE